MKLRVFVSTLCLALSFLAACKRQETVEVKKAGSPQTQSSDAKFDACALLTREEIEAVQKSPVSNATGNSRSDGGLRISQCYFATAESNRSISLQVTQPDPAAKERKSGAEVWEQTFGRYESEKEGEKEKEKEREKERPRGAEEEQGAPPKKIEGVGDEAFWAGNRVGGALYILKNDSFVRLSLGGPDTEEVKIEKSKELAKKILGHL